LVARIGGEEFAWLMPDTDAAGGRAAADRARLAISSLDVDGAGSITVSVGVCGFAAQLEPQQLMRCADEALYEAKEAGRDRTVVHGDVRSPIGAR
jgi:diguanylate cyclase (GGDEF)-like protein